MAEAFSIDCRQAPGIAHVSPRGELDLATVPALDALLEEEQAEPGRLVIVDLRTVTFLDATGIGCLIRARERAEAAGSELAIVRGARRVQRAVELVGLDDALPFVDQAPGEPG